MTGEAYDPGRAGATMDLEGAMSYGDYLHLDLILGAQFPQGAAHDELCSSFNTRHPSFG